jgi:polyisoprenoid-binding protein YceI
MRFRSHPGRRFPHEESFMKTVRTISLALAALLSFAALASATPVSYTVDKTHTEVGFEVRHIFSRVHGRFNEFTGTIVFDEQNPAAIQVDATAEAKSIWTDNDRRDNHLRSADFFAVDSFPTLTFKSTKVTADGKNKYKVAGNLTMRGVTRPVVFDGEFLGAGAFGIGGHSMGNKAGFVATTVVNRKDYGINWNKTLDNGGLMLSDEVTLTLNIEADQVQAAAK